MSLLVDDRKVTWPGQHRQGSEMGQRGCGSDCDLGAEHQAKSFLEI